MPRKSKDPKRYTVSDKSLSVGRKKAEVGNPALPTHLLNKEVSLLVIQFFDTFKLDAYDGTMTTGDVLKYVSAFRPGTKASTVYPCIAAYGPVGEDDRNWYAHGTSKRYGRYEV